MSSHLLALGKSMLATIAPPPRRPVHDMEVKYLSGLAGKPVYGSDSAAGMDLRSAMPGTITLRPTQTTTISTGIAFNMKNPSIVGLVFPRSSKGRAGLQLQNTTPVIDADYQGEVMLMVRNWRRDVDLVIEEGERIAQIVFLPIVVARLTEVTEFSSATERGVQGFGSTGRKELIGAAAA